MQVQNIGGPGPFVQVVDILGDDLYFKILFQLRQDAVRLVGLSLPYRFAPHIVKFKYQCRVFSPGRVGRHFLNIIPFP